MKNTFRYGILKIVILLWLTMSTLFAGGQENFGSSGILVDDRIEEYDDLSGAEPLFSLTTQNFGEDPDYVPLNGGLLVLNAGALGYLTYK